MKQCSYCISMYYSLGVLYLVGPLLVWITTSTCCGMETISLWFCWGSGSLGCFDIYLQIISLVGSSVSSSSWQYSMNSQKTLGQAVYWSIQHNSTMVIKAGTGIFGNVYRYQILLENEVSISIKLCSRRNHEVPSIEFQHRLLWQRWIW